MADFLTYDLTQTGDEVQDILDSALKVTGSGVTLSQSGEDVQALLNDVASEEFERTTGMTAIPANSDLNDYKDVGTYNVTRNTDASTIVNSPTSTAFKMVVDKTLGGDNATQTLTTYTGEMYIRTYQSYDSTWTAWVKVGNAFTTAKATVTVTKVTGNRQAITAPTVSGYTFLCWLGSATNGWIGSTYIENMTTASTNVWVSYATTTSGTGSVDCWALYIQN